MATHSQLDTADAAKPQFPALEAHWSLRLRVAFRFCFAEFILYCLTAQIVFSVFTIPTVSSPNLAGLWPKEDELPTHG